MFPENPRELPMGLMGDQMFKTFKSSRSMSKTSNHNETELKTRQPSPFVQNSAAENEAPGEMEKRILRKAPPGSLPDGVLG